uniref:Uncharacterized protein n=1 Tax=Physcomitrium patens TaxID=3218 RepID=A0A2K1LAZ0_PHYPA|nr:hypothetical protein PHYPA_001621 [Physcomitrium patens]
MVGIFYSKFVATMVVQRIWQRHNHSIAKWILTNVTHASSLGFVDQNTEFNAGAQKSYVWKKVEKGVGHEYDF